MVDKYKLIDGILFVLAMISVSCLCLTFPVGLALGCFLEEKNGSLPEKFGLFVLGWIVVHFILGIFWLALGDFFRDIADEKRKCN